jgi:ABC-type transport system substrate-binding protein
VSPFDNYGDVAVVIQAAWNSIGIKADLQYPQVGAFAGMLTGTWKNGVLFGPGPLSANPNAGWSALAPTSACFFYPST